MAEQDLQAFLEKVSQLQQMVDSLDETPFRRKLLAACTNHNEVVQLASSWGFEIGRRWGEPSGKSDLVSKDNLFNRPLPQEGFEQKFQIQEGDNWRLELIVSNAAMSQKGFWYDQEENEWILILQGSALLRLRDPDGTLDMSVGDHLLLPSRRLHRIERTNSAPGTIWLSLLWK